MALAWENDGGDLVIQLALAGGATRRFTFTWVDRLSVSIVQQPEGPSQPFSWDGNAERLPGGRVKVILDFAHQGAITFECQEIMADGT